MGRDPLLAEEEGILDAKLGVSEEQIRQEWADVLGLGDIMPDDPEARSTRELAEIMGISRSAVENRMRVAMQEGRAERLHVMRAGSDGRIMEMYVYRMIAK